MAFLENLQQNKEEIRDSGVDLHLFKEARRHVVDERLRNKESLLPFWVKWQQNQ
jgi:hypothetical protein